MGLLQPISTLPSGQAVLVQKYDLNGFLTLDEAAEEMRCSVKLVLENIVKFNSLKPHPQDRIPNKWKTSPGCKRVISYYDFRRLSEARRKGLLDIEIDDKPALPDVKV